MSATVTGFVGLGNMGGELARNLVNSGLDVVVFDVDPARTTDGARRAADIAELAQAADTVVFSLPDGSVSETVARALVAAPGRRTSHVVDTSTVGITAARAIAALLGAEGVGYVDTPVSGGAAGARARTLAVMFAGSDDACAHVEPVLAGLSDRRRRVGDRPGMAQALKLANNFLSATALAAASEAVSFGLAAGLDMATMLEVLNQASGQSAATSDKFVNHVLTGRYASGFANSLMSKDVRLYLQEVGALGGPAAVGAVTGSVWQGFAEAEPGVDFTRIFPYVQGSGVQGPGVQSPGVADADGTGS